MTRLVSVLLFACLCQAQENRGYYRFPAISGSTIVFTAEGDLWVVGVEGGLARRLTSHPGEETRASFSPDGKTIAFSANYEGPTEIYTMPANGGLPTRRTFDGGEANVTGWTPDGKIIYTTRRYSTLPNWQLATIRPDNGIDLVPLSQASQGCFAANSRTLFFTRLPFQGSYAKRYKGGTAQNLWKFIPGEEAIPLTSDYAGTSKDAMYWNGRVYFLTDRDGTMNIWSMDEFGKNLRQHTKHQGWDAQSPSLSRGRIVYKLGAALRLLDTATGVDKAIDIQLPSDFDHLRERWVKNPLDYTTAVNLSHDGSSVVLTSRGRVFVAPVKAGRLVNATARKPGRYRDGRMMPDGKNLLTLSTESGEVELWKVPANGIGKAEQLTTDGKVLRWEGIPSPDGKWIAHQNKDNELWLLDSAAKTQKKIAVASFARGNSGPNFQDIRWSPDSRWISYSVDARNTFSQVFVYNVETGVASPVTTDRYNNTSAAWSPDGKWLYFLSDRVLRSTVMSPWGPRQPDPYFDRSVKVYQLALKKGLRSPFDPPDELHPDKTDDSAKKDEKQEKVKVDIDLDGIVSRIQEVPAPAGNYVSLNTTGKRLCWVNRDRTNFDRNALECMEIGNKGDKPETLIEGVNSYQLSGDRKKIMFRKQADIYVVDAGVKGSALSSPKGLADNRVDLKDWSFSVIPNDEYKEALLDAWRLHRDYFYDRNMHGVNWTAMRDKYLELIGRVRDREELSDLIAQMVSELSVLHTFVFGGDVRRGNDQVQPASLGAVLSRDQEAGGYLIKHIYQTDSDRPDKRAPLARPGLDVQEGDILLAINGRDTLSATDPGELLRNQAGKQVLLRIRPKGKTEPRDVIVKPISLSEEVDLRYSEWEYTRRVSVEKASAGEIGYVHLRAMTASDINQWVEEYFPVFDRQGLIIDVRHNNGGNIDSWILGKLLRKAWMYWQPRVGAPNWNMQYAFRGHLVVLCDERTASDGEAFTEGFRRLGLGKAIGTRTWGGEIWLSSSNTLADRGIATAAETGVYGPERKWLIEGHGVDPDIVVDNLPFASFQGKDAQLEAAIKHLQNLIAQKPATLPPAPAYPDKSFTGVSRALRD